MKRKCPHCHKIVKALPKEQSEQAKFLPFCSLRCKLIDLGAWLDGKYKISTELQTQEPSEPPNSSSERSGDMQ